MSRLLVVCVATLLVATFATVLQAAPPMQTGEVPDAVLANLGMAGMERVSDTQGEAIRGKWFFSKRGNSFAAGMYIMLNALPIAKETNDVVDVGGGTGFWLGGGAAPSALLGWNNWDNSLGTVPAGTENIAARTWRNSVNQVNQIFATQFPNGINGLAGYGPGVDPALPLAAPVGYGEIGGINPVVNPLAVPPFNFQFWSGGGVGGPFYR